MFDWYTWVLIYLGVGLMWSIGEEIVFKDIRLYGRYLEAVLSLTLWGPRVVLWVVILGWLGVRRVLNR